MNSEARVPVLGETSDVVVRVCAVSKAYGIWSSPKARLAHPILNAFARVFPGSQGIQARLNSLTQEMYREFHALKNISLDIKKGESWGFLGVNGSGKSTLLKIISGNLRPTSGYVEVEGRVAILDYGSGISGDFTGRENVYLKASILGLSKKQIDERFDSIAAFADIGEFMDQPVKTYSSGMTARLGFAIMAHVDADIMISDEALAVGDAFFVQKCMAHIRTFLAKGTFLFVSHAVNDVVALCQKALWLDGGEIRAIGTAKDVADAYLSSASMSRSRRYLGDSGTDTAQRAEASVESIPAGSITLTQTLLAPLSNARAARVIRDPRQDLMLGSNLRNDIELPRFSLDTPGFGVGGARIVDVSFEDDDGNALSWIIGGELARLTISLVAERILSSPIVGFQVKDRLGQTLFADNTYLNTLDRAFRVQAGARFLARFRFQVPLLPVGEYVVRAAVADGSESENAMLHCVDNALVFRSVTSGARHGLVGVPMQEISLELDLQHH